MIRVRDLQPGDVVVHASSSATFVAQAEHPIWPSLRLVIWRLRDGSWSHDALSPEQEVGEVLPVTTYERQTSCTAGVAGRVPGRCRTRRRSRRGTSTLASSRSGGDREHRPIPASQRCAGGGR